MYLLLLVFGAVLSVAGMVLAASGVSLHDRTFDATIVTPGVVAAVGGLLLIGLGLALRVLQRIEHALRPGRCVTASRSGSKPAAASAAEPHRAPCRFRSRRSAAAPAVAPLRDASGQGGWKLPEKTPAVARLESAGVAEETDMSLSPTAATDLGDARR